MMAEIDDAFAHLVYRTHEGLQASLFRAVAPGKGLARQDIGLLGFLHTVEAASISVAAEKCRVAKSQLSLVVERLEARGYVERRPDEEDRRVSRIASTPKGERALVAAYKGVRDRVGEFFAPLSAKELATVGRACEIIAGLLAREDERS